MADPSTDMNHPILNLTPDEKRAYSFLFNQADSDQLGVVTGERAVAFFERTSVSATVLGEIWQIADTENRGLLTKPGFCMVLRLIGHYQAGKEPSAELAFSPAPIPHFDSLQIPNAAPPTSPKVGSPVTVQFPPNVLQPELSGQTGPIRVPPLDPQKVQQYSGLFERSGAQGGLLDGATAKSIFERAGLPNEVLGRIWALSDRQQRGALDQTEFIVAMHLLTSFKTRSMPAVPATLPQGLYDAAARRGVPPPPAARQPQAPVARQFSGQASTNQIRTQSPLARPGGFASPPIQTPSSTGGIPWLVSQQEKVKYDQFFASVDSAGLGALTGEQAVRFFSDSGLSEETLAQIWDLADINSEGQLNRDEFAVAMYLIRQQRGPNSAPLPAFLPPALIPPSMRQPSQQMQSTAPTFNNSVNTSSLPKSAAEDLFGLDAPASPVRPQQTPQAPLQAQTTGLSSSRDPFSNSPVASPSSPQRFAPQAQIPSTMFKPFMPTSAFGTSLAQQNTGGSASSSQGLPRPVPPPSNLQRTSASDDLLGDDETHKIENSKITNETTELANMSNQIGNLRSQMEQTQGKKTTTQQELNTTLGQKQDLEARLQQFRTQYEQEVRTVKELEQQLTSSREAIKKLSQDLAMIEGTHQDLKTQHATLSQQLQVDQDENASLKQRIAQINGEVSRLKPEIEKLKLDARQQKGMVSINKKQLTTNEAERDRLQQEKSDLEREATEHAKSTQARSGSTDVFATDVGQPGTLVASPAGSAIGSKNPFFRGPSTDVALDRAVSTVAGPVSNAPNPSAFDAIFGPSSAFAPSGTVISRNGTPPATSFIGRSIAPATQRPTLSDSVQSLSSAGETTPSATPPPHEPSADTAVEPPPIHNEQLAFSPNQLPVVYLHEREETDASSTRVLPPGSQVGGGLETPLDSTDSFAATPAALETLPGAFPSDNHEDFDAAFADFQQDKETSSTQQTKDAAPLSGVAEPSAKTSIAPTEFPPIQNLEPEDDDSDDSDDDYSSAAAKQPETSSVTAASSAAPPSIATQVSPPPYQREDGEAKTQKRSGSIDFPPEFGGLLPAREDSTTLPMSPESHITSSREAGLGTAPARLPSPSTTVTHQSQTSSSVAPAQQSAFDEVDDFADFSGLAEAKEADPANTGTNFGFGQRSVDEFNPVFDSPAPSMSTTILSQSTPTVTKSVQPPGDSHGFGDFSSSINSASKATNTAEFSSGSGEQNSQSSTHDWDAIFSSLDSSKTTDTSLNGSSDPWNTGRPAEANLSIDMSQLSQPAVPTIQKGGALTPGTEHDAPMLKHLTSMGYPRADALRQLEKFDYDIGAALDALNSGAR